ncbi:MAG: caspase family protein [Candidatus Electrothrix sp. EH2]|nr:caspase family protein [Candidatus Electrothrix sp. EH2]
MNKHLFSNGHALIIGVKTYSPHLKDLSCTLKDAEGLAGILKDEGRCAYPPEQVTLLTDSKADRKGILAALDTLAEVTDADSTVVIYFSGHGGKKDGGYYFCPYRFDPAALQETAISGPEFKDKIAAIPAKKKLILLDCCHAGGIGSGVKGEGFTKAAVPPEAIELFQQGKGCVVIASSAEDEFSYVGKTYSIFTGALIEALSGKGVSRKDGYVRATDLAMYTRERVSRLTEDKQHPQHPTLDFEEADNFVLAYYAGGEKEAKEVSFVLQVEGSEESGVMEQINEILKTVKAIEKLVINARYEQAYTKFYQLCDDYPDYQSNAAGILSRFRNFQNKCIQGILSVQQQDIVEMQIKHAFDTCLKRFKQEYLTSN